MILIEEELSLVRRPSPELALHGWTPADAINWQEVGALYDPPEVVELNQAREDLRTALEKKGHILPETHFFCIFLQEALAFAQDDLPAGLKIWVVDGDGKEMYYSPRANTVVAGRGFFRFFVEKSHQRQSLTQDIAGLRDNPFAALLKEHQCVFATDHIVEVIKHEIRHGQQEEDRQEKLDDSEIEWNITSFFANRHRMEYDADLHAMLDSASQYNPWAMVDLLWLAQADFGTQSWSHPDIVDRVRVLEEVLANDNTPVPNTTKAPTALPPQILEWLRQPSEAYAEVDRLATMNAHQLHELIVQTQDIPTFLTSRNYWEHQILLEQSLALATHPLIKKLVNICLARRFLQDASGSWYYHEFKGDLEAFIAADAVIGKALKDLRYGFKRDQDKPYFDPGRLILAPEAETVWTQPWPHTPYPESVADELALVIEQLTLETNGLIALIAAHLEQHPQELPDTVAYLTKVQQLLQTSLNEDLSDSDLQKLMECAFPLYDQKIELFVRKKQAQHAAESNHQKTYKRQRASKQYGIDDPLFDFDQQAEVKRAYQLCLVSLAAHFVNIPDNNDQLSHFMHLTSRGTAIHPEDAQAITDFMFKKDADVRRHFSQLIDYQRLWEAHYVVRYLLPERTPVMFSPDHPYHQALQESRLVLLQGTAPNQYRCHLSESSSHSQRMKGIYPYNNVSSLRYLTLQPLSFLLDPTFNKDPIPDPFSAEAPLTLPQLITLSKESGDRTIAYYLQEHALRHYITHLKNGTSASETILELVDRCQEFPTHFPIEDLWFLVEHSHLPDEQLFNLISSVEGMLNQQYALTGDSLSWQLLLRGYELSKKITMPTAEQEEAKVSLLHRITGAALWYQLSHLDLQVTHSFDRDQYYFLRGEEGEKVHLGMLEAEASYLRQTHHKQAFFQAFTQTMAMLDQAQLPLRLSSFYYEENTPKTYAHRNPSFKGTPSYGDWFTPDLGRCLGLLESADFIPLIQAVQSLPHQVETNRSTELFSLVEELRLIQTIVSSKRNLNQKDELVDFVKGHSRATEWLDLGQVIYEVHGQHALQWLLDHFHPSAARDELVLLLALEDQRFFAEVEHRYQEIVSTQPDSGTDAKKSVSFAWTEYTYFYQYPHRGTVMSQFKGPGLIGNQFDNLLRRRNNFAGPLINYRNYTFRSISTFEPGSFHQQFLAQSMLAHEQNLLAAELSFTQRLELLQTWLPQECLLRDQYLEVLSRDELSKANDHQQEIALINQVVDLFSPTNVFRQRLGGRLLQLEIFQGKQWTDYDQGMTQINDLLPSQSLVRSYFLHKLATMVPLTHLQATELSQAMTTSDQGKDQLLSEVVVIFDLFAELTRAEKYALTRWLLGLSNDKPDSVQDVEKTYDGHLDDFPAFFQRLLPPEQEVLFRRMLLGEQGIFDLDAVPHAELPAAESLRDSLIQQVAKKLVPDDRESSAFLQEVFGHAVQHLPASYGSKLFTHLMAAYLEKKSLGQELAIGQLAAMFLVEMLTPGTKAAQTLGDLKTIPTEFRQALQTTQEYAGKKIPATGLFQLLEPEGLLAANDHGFVVKSIDALLGDASNKQGALLTIEVTSAKLRQLLQLAPSQTTTQVVGRFKRPSSQKTTMMETYFRLGDELLKLSQTHFLDSVPPRLVETLKNATYRELDFHAETVFSEKYRAFAREISPVGPVAVDVPLIFYTSEAMIFETIAPGTSLREYFQEQLATNAADSQEEQVKLATLAVLLLGLLKEGLLHADPTFGNIHYSAKESLLSLLDRGMHAYLNEQEQAACLDLIIGLQTKNRKMITKACQVLGWQLPNKPDLQFKGNFFENADALVQAVTFSETPVPDHLSSVAFVIFKLQAYFENLSPSTIQQLTEILRKELSLGNMMLLNKLLFR